QRLCSANKKLTRRASRPPRLNPLRTVELSEEPRGLGCETWKTRRFSNAFAARVSRLRVPAQYQNLARIRQNDPHDGHAVVQIPARLAAQDLLVFVLAGNLDSEQRRCAAKLADRPPDIGPPPDSSVGCPYVIAELHPGFVDGDDELAAAR